jgi:hypothetical protein
MSDDRKKPVWPWIAALLIGLPALYVLSFGPACYLVSNQTVSSKNAWRAFRPLARLGVYGPEWATSGISRYARLWYVRDPDALGIRLWETPFEIELEFNPRAR